MKIYTKSGDSGTTSLFGGQRVEKDSARIRAYGNVDELNSLIGVILADFEELEGIRPLKKKLFRIQSELFVLGSDLATPAGIKTKVPRIAKRHIKRLEGEIDSWSEKLPKLGNFIFPGGGKIGAKLHLARTLARRTERAIVNLAAQEKINKRSLRSSASPAGLKNILPYINRLSDWLFVSARYVNKLENQSENIWKGRGG